SAEKGAARLLPQHIAVRLAPLADSCFDHRGKPSRHGTEKAMPCGNQFARRKILLRRGRGGTRPGEWGGGARGAGRDPGGGGGLAEGGGGERRGGGGAAAGGGGSGRGGGGMARGGGGERAGGGGGGRVSARGRIRARRLGERGS